MEPSASYFHSPNMSLHGGVYGAERERREHKDERYGGFDGDDTDGT